MTLETAMEVLKQDEIKSEFLSDQKPWTVVYKSWYKKDDWNGAIFSALSPQGYREKALGHDSRDLSIGEGAPQFSQTFPEGEEPKANYLRFGNFENIEPLVIIQTTYGVRDKQVKLCDEFVLFHNLWEDKQTGKLIKVEDDGNEVEVAKITDSEVQVRTAYIKQFIAAKQYDFLLFIDSVKYVDYKGEMKLGSLTQTFKGKTYRLQRDGNVGIGRTDKFSRLVGKKIIFSPPIEQSGVWPFENKVEEYPEFIVAESEAGKPVYSSCNPDSLRNNFGGDKESSHYLTPVFFKREVLHKYYEKPELYSVEDGYLRCKGLWGLRMDNDNPEHIVVFLGDLGRDLPSSERHHWKSHNVEAIGGISHTNFQRSFMSEFADAQAPDIVFRRKYKKLVDDWNKAKGWQLFKEPNGDDKLILGKIRIPLNESATEFEGQISYLTKLLVDRLNEQQISKELGGSLEGEKGIQKLERYFKLIDYPFTDRDIALLKELQSIRSQGVAHSKSTDYKNFINEKTNGDTRYLYVGKLLIRATAMLDQLQTYVEGV